MGASVKAVLGLPPVKAEAGKKTATPEPSQDPPLSSPPGMAPPGLKETVKKLVERQAKTDQRLAELEALLKSSRETIRTQQERILTLEELVNVPRSQNGTKDV